MIFVSLTAMVSCGDHFINDTDYRKQVGELSFDRKIQIKMYPGGGYVAKIQKK